MVENGGYYDMCVSPSALWFCNKSKVTGYRKVLRERLWISSSGTRLIGVVRRLDVQQNMGGTNKDVRGTQSHRARARVGTRAVVVVQITAPRLDGLQNKSMCCLTCALCGSQNQYCAVYSKKRVLRTTRLPSSNCAMTVRMASKFQPLRRSTANHSPFDARRSNPNQLPQCRSPPSRTLNCQPTNTNAPLNRQAP